MALTRPGDNILTCTPIYAKNMSVYNAHKISDDLENSIKEDFPLVKNVIIHLDCLLN